MLQFVGYHETMADSSSYVSFKFGAVACSDIDQVGAADTSQSTAPRPIEVIVERDILHGPRDAENLVELFPSNGVIRVRFKNIR